ncbi:DNA replication protein DnaD [Companilactobacillus sp. RD055328]|uniref:DnaD domain-containing protein n=1 Tax=Companilactobacillus sp. RD055328 TaxID=2916634 RepID=UPI001FC82EEA|nr:DnaD domain protein [Companilactobacillus sp. RD055328]GKQ42684.1 DNA replication protein DnaD [Companilactobacillus sp. RD055328]
MSINILDKLIKDGSTSINNVILLNLHNLSLNAEEFLIFSVLEMYSQKNNKFPTPELIQKTTGLEQSKIMNIIQSLIKKNIIDIKTEINRNHQQQDAYDLTPVYYQLEQILSKTDEEANKLAQENKLRTLFKMIEVEFGRPTSPIEQETIHDWINQSHYSIDLIQLALKEAVLNQAYSFKYMDRILLNWEKQNIKTPIQLEESKRRNEL